MKTFMLIASAVLLLAPQTRAATNAASYAIVVAPETWAKPDWATVVRALEVKYQGQVIVVQSEESAMREALRGRQPRYACWVARPEEIDELYVRRIHRVARALDEDPYEDFVWGIVTGYTARDALRVAQRREALVVKSALTLTELAPEKVECLLTLSDSKRGGWLRKEAGAITSGLTQNGTLTALCVDFLQRHEIEAMVTSGHASPFNVELSFTQGALVCGGNRIYLVEPEPFRQWVRTVGAGRAETQPWFEAPQCEIQRLRWAAANEACALKLSDHPKVFVAAGNCLLGNPLRQADSMVVTLLSAGGFDQFVGYTLSANEGAGGWGTLRLWAGPAGCNTLAEACFLSTQNVIYELLQACPALQEELMRNREATPAETKERMRRLAQVPASRRQWALNALHDLDGLVLFGDPQWSARLSGAGAELRARWASDGDGWRLVVEPLKAIPATERYLFRLPLRVTQPRVTDAAGLSVAVTDEFVVLGPHAYRAGQKHEVRIGWATAEARLETASKR